jgi:hypothetical protein
MSGPDLTHLFEEEFAKPPSEIEVQAAVAALGEEYPPGWRRTAGSRAPSCGELPITLLWLTGLSSTWGAGAVDPDCGSQA